MSSSFLGMETGNGTSWSFCSTVGDLKKVLEDIPNDTKLSSVGDNGIEFGVNVHNTYLKQLPTESHPCFESIIIKTDETDEDAIKSILID